MNHLDIFGGRGASGDIMHKLNLNTVVV